LFMKHSSKPYNPKLANIFFKSGMIEAWGRGFEKIREACALYDGPLLESDRNSHPKTSRINQSESDRNSQS